MERRLQAIWWDGSVVGHLIHRGAIYFVYDEAWIKRGHDLSPLCLPFTTVAFNGNKEIDGVPGLIADCLPDSWGRKVARLEFGKHKWGEPTSMSLLAWRGQRGVGALHFMPSLQERPSALESISAAALARGAAEIQRGEPSKVLEQLAMGGTAGGAFPKSLVLAYADGTLRVGPPDGKGQPSLLKIDLSEDGNKAVAEHAYAVMAQAAGIRSVETQLIKEKGASKRRHLLVKRFDFPEITQPERRLHFHSLSGLLQKSPGELDYRDLFRTAIRLDTSPQELREIARRMVFNVLASNHDDHAKNHAFLYHEERREWFLTPAFDVTYDAGILERGMLINGEVWPEATTMEVLCLDAGLGKDEIRQIFREVVRAIKRWPTFAKEAGLSAAKTKEIGERHQLIQSRIKI